MNCSLFFKNNLFNLQYNVLLRYSYSRNRSNCCLGKSTINILFKSYCCQSTSGNLFPSEDICLFKRRKYSKMDINSQQMFRLSDYDCIGFDLDNTLCEYKIKPMVQMEYSVLSRYLVETRGYDSKFLYAPLTSDDVDFLQRGLILDFERGNVLKLDEEGVIIAASHGTKELSESDVKFIYGESMTFHYSKLLCKDLTCAWDENLKSKFRILLDYFDLPASLGFARAVDSLRARGDNNYYAAGRDVLSALVYMYSRENFGTNVSNYFKELKLNPEKYINKCSEDFISWLKEVGKSKVLFLITGSNVDYASFTASYCLGEEWLDIFDVVICYSRKPGFFFLKRPFLEVSGLKECGEINSNELKLNKIYSQGNWNDLQTLLREAVPSDSPKFLYIGDNVVEDIFTPHKNLLCDTLAITEELAAEKIWNFEGEHPSKEYLVSRRWGSFFKDTLTSKPTLWGSVINNCSKLCLPSVSALTNIPIKENIVFHEIEGCKVISSKDVQK